MGWGGRLYRGGAFLGGGVPGPVKLGRGGNLREFREYSTFWQYIEKVLYILIPLKNVFFSKKVVKNARRIAREGLQFGEINLGFQAEI